MISKHKTSKSTNIRVFCMPRLFIYQLCSFCLLSIYSPQVFCELKLDSQNGKRLVKQLKAERSKLQNALHGLLALQESSSNRVLKDHAKQLSRVEKLLQAIQHKAMLYFHGQRTDQFSSKLTLQLRDEIWSLLDYRNDLFQRVKGHFCLRPHWERTMAQRYLKLQKNSLAITHYLRAYHCGGQQQDLELARQIKDSFALSPSK